jgi:hypothetical protein
MLKKKIIIIIIIKMETKTLSNPLVIPIKQDLLFALPGSKESAMCEFLKLLPGALPRYKNEL